MKKFLLSCAALALMSPFIIASSSGVSVMSDTVEEVYVIGEFNNYQQSDDYVLTNLDESNLNELGNVFSIPAGEFKFYISYNGVDYVPSGDGVVSASSNHYQGNYVESSGAVTYWTYENWPGGGVDVTVDVANQTIDIYLSPDQTVPENSDYEVISTDGGITLKWSNVDDIYNSASEGAYLVPRMGRQINLTNTRYVSSLGIYEGNIKPNGSNVEINLENLEIPSGQYTLVIPQGYFEVVWDDWEIFGTNPTIKEDIDYVAPTYPESISVLGEFNDFTASSEFVINNLDEDTPAVLGGLLEIPEGEFDLYLQNGDTYYFANAVVSEVSLDESQFNSSFVTASTVEDGCHWTCENWPGGTVDFNINLAKQTVTMYLKPVKTVPENSDYEVIPADGGVTLKWSNVDDIYNSASEGAYLVPTSGRQINLTNTRYVSSLGIYEGNIKPDGSNVAINLANLEIPSGQYTLVIPQGYFEVVWDDWETWGTNPYIKVDINYVAPTYPESISVLGEFNDFTASSEFVINNLDEDTPAVLGGLLEIPEGEFDLYLQNGDTYYFANAVVSEVSLDESQFNSSFVTASTVEDGYHWTCENWPGGTVDFNINLAKQTVTMYLKPVQTVPENSDYEVIPADGGVTLKWSNVDDIYNSASEGAYLVPTSGRQINLTNTRYVSSLGIYEGNIKPDGSNVAINLANLEIPSGQYTLVIPQGYFEVVWDDWETWGTNPYIKEDIDYVAPTYPESISVLGEFNDFTASSEFVINNLDEDTPAVLGGLLEIPEGEFDLYLQNGDTYYFANAVVSEVSLDESQFNSSFVTASTVEDGYHWTCENWPGGTVDFNINLAKQTVTMYLSPSYPPVLNSDYTVTRDGNILTVIWDESVQVSMLMNQGAYLLNGEHQIPLTNRRYDSTEGDYQGNIQILYDEPAGVDIYLEDLELENGNYTLVIPQGYFEVVWDDWDVFGQNAAIEYSFTYGVEPEEPLPYWYIRGEFNDYNPDGVQTWALMDDEEGTPGVFTGTFTVPAGEFSFNLQNAEGFIYVPMDEDGYTTQETVVFVNNVYNGVSTMATDDYDETCFWVDPSWEGGMITVTVNANGNNPTVRIDAIPAISDFNDEYEISTFNSGLGASIYWEAENICDAWWNEGEAYIQNAAGEKTELVRTVPGREGQVTIEDADPYGISIDLASLELPVGTYTIVIPAEYIMIASDDYDVMQYNPEISFNISVETSGIYSLGIDAENADIYTLQGVKINHNNNLKSGIYIINGKKVMIRK